MQDQLDRLPPCLKAMCLSGIEATETHASFLRLRDGNYNVLFLSPERLMSSRFQAFARTPGALPPIALVGVLREGGVGWRTCLRPGSDRLC